MQKDYFEVPFDENFRWRTENPYISNKESGLLASLSRHIQQLPDDARILEVACGEGPNIALLRKSGVMQNIHGIDYSHNRVTFCQRNLDKIIGTTTSATALAYKDETFDCIFFRDLLHHVEGAQKLVLAECLRVLKPGGRLCFMEANGLNPCFMLLALAIKAERGLFKSNAKNIYRLIAPYKHHRLTMYEPSNFFRLFFHYSAGFPRLAHVRIFTLITDVLSKIAGVVVPKKFWAYICVEIIK